MLFQESQIRGLDSFDFLDSVDYLDESASYPAGMVPIKYNQRLDQEMIQLESMVDYALTNGISNASDAIRDICADNNAHMNKISFCVNESNVIADPEMADTVYQLRECGYLVNVQPISSESIYYTKLQEAIELDEQFDDYENSAHILQYVNENVFEDASNKVSDVWNSAKGHVSKNWNNMKKYASETKENMAKKYAAIKKTISEKMAKAKKAAGEAKVSLLKQIDKLKKAASDLKAKIAKKIGK